jgi:DNA (cytosine-5)-methyltransferase 1
MEIQPTVISTFSGCGGSSLGYKWAGYKEILAIDFDKNSVDTFRLNFPEIPIWQRDITTVKAEEVLEFCNLKKGELDLLDGSPPCQGFSTAGKRNVNDERNQLFKSFVYLIEELQPKVFLMENVSGMMKGKMKGMFIEVMNELKSLDYNVKCKLMNAANYEVPQSRQRLIWIGIRKDLIKQPSFPMPNNKIITVKEALKNIIPSETPLLNDKYGKLWLMIKFGGNASNILKIGQNSCVKLNPNKPSCTLPKTQTGKGFATICHWIEKRAISINEAKILCSFPESFKLIGSYSKQWARLGNAVMPKFMYHLARHIRDNFLT